MTLDALSKYAGFSNWHNLRLAASGEQVKNAPAVNKQPYGRKKKIKIPNKVIFIKYVLIVVPVLFSISILHSTFRSKETDFKINVRNPIDTIPFTAVFDYHIPVNARDTFYLNIPESGSVRFPLVPGTNIFTHWFRNAGFYHVTLQNKSRILDTLYVYALSKNWQSGITRHPDILLFKPLSLNKNCKSLDSLLYTSPYQLYKLGFDNLSNYFMEFRLFKSFDVCLDDCEVSFVARNNNTTGGKPCYDIDLDLVGDEGHIRAIFTDEKCFRFDHLIVSEINYDGRNHDLSMLSTALSNCTQFRIVVKNNSASISIDGEERFKQEYINPTGTLKGIIIRFFGSGQAKNLRIINGKGEEQELTKFIIN